MLEALCLRAYADGRFDVFLEDEPIYRTAEHRYQLPDYDADIRPSIERLNARRAG